MFPYFGRKYRIAHHYPMPKHDTIIEPFAGSAAYSLFSYNWNRQVILIDAYDVVCKIWRYLQQAKPEDILKIPKDHIPKSLCQEEIWLRGFLIGEGSQSPRREIGNFSRSYETNIKRIANDLHKIKHWQIIEGYYIRAPDIKATWFIDPPYQYGGTTYMCKFNQYVDLANWIKKRQGQVMVCENNKANWLPFKPLIETRSGRNEKQIECLYYQENR